MATPTQLTPGEMAALLAKLQAEAAASGAGDPAGGVQGQPNPLMPLAMAAQGAAAPTQSPGTSEALHAAEQSRVAAEEAARQRAEAALEATKTSAAAPAAAPAASPSPGAMPGKVAGGRLLSREEQAAIGDPKEIRPYYSGPYAPDQFDPTKENSPYKDPNFHGAPIGPRGASTSLEDWTSGKYKSIEDVPAFGGWSADAGTSTSSAPDPTPKPGGGPAPDPQVSSPTPIGMPQTPYSAPPPYAGYVSGKPVDIGAYQAAVNKRAAAARRPTMKKGPFHWYA